MQHASSGVRILAALGKKQLAACNAGTWVHLATARRAVSQAEGEGPGKAWSEGGNSTKTLRTCAKIMIKWHGNPVSSRPNRSLISHRLLTNSSDERSSIFERCAMRTRGHEHETRRRRKNQTLNTRAMETSICNHQAVSPMKRRSHLIEPSVPGIR